MRQSTRSLLVAFGTATAVVLTPLAMGLGGHTVDEVPPAAGATVEPVHTTGQPVEPAQPTEQPVQPALSPVDDASDADTPPTGTAPPTGAATETGSDAPVPMPGSAPALPGSGSGMGGDLPPEALPTPPYPQCPITEAGAWWTDPADPYTCIPPGSLPFHEPTPPGIPPELLEPIFETPGTEPGADDDCRTTGALRCTVTIMGQDYVVTFAEGKPVAVAEAP